MGGDFPDAAMMRVVGVAPDPHRCQGEGAIDMEQGRGGARATQYRAVREVVEQDEGAHGQQRPEQRQRGAQWPPLQPAGQAQIEDEQREGRQHVPPAARHALAGVGSRGLDQLAAPAQLVTAQGSRCALLGTRCAGGSIGRNTLFHKESLRHPAAMAFVRLGVLAPRGQSVCSARHPSRQALTHPYDSGAPRISAVVADSRLALYTVFLYSIVMESDHGRACRDARATRPPVSER